MSLIPTNPIIANYIQQAVINSYENGTSNFTTSQNGQGIRSTNNTTGAYLEFSSSGLNVSPDGTTIYDIHPVNIIATNTPPNQTTFSVSDKIQVDNTTIGGINNPTLVLNQTTAGGGSMVEESYNAKTASAGEFSRKSFYAKNSSGVKTEYARISTYSPVISAGTTKGKLDLGVNVNGSVSTLFSCNANTNQNDSFAPLHLNSNPIIQVPSISSVAGNPYAKNSIQYFTGDNTIPNLTPENDLRLTLINQGKPHSLQPLSGSFPNSWGTILCSTYFNGYTYVGTDNGYVYYSNDGSTWGQINDNFNGAVKTMCSQYGYLYIGGTFTQGLQGMGNTYNYIAQVDSGGNVNTINWNNTGYSTGFNGVVNCLYTDSRGYVLVGGNFNYDSNNNLQLNYIACFDSNNTLFPFDGNVSTNNGYGFNAEVLFIKQDANMSNMCIIGGSFTALTTGYYGYISCNYNVVCNFNSYISLNSAPYQILGMNARPLCIAQNGNQFYCGGEFTGTPYANYLATFEYDYGSSQYILVPNVYGATPNNPINQILQYSGIWWSELNSNAIYLANQLQVSSPYGSSWSCLFPTIWSGNKNVCFSTSSSSQNPTTAFYLDTSDAITLSLTGGQTIQGANATYSGGVVLSYNGSCVELIYNQSLSKWFLINNQASNLF